MKKNISINISGIIFHIEEDGYESLRKYLDSINRYFASFEDSSEIISDIESRIAEIFLSKLNEGKQVITAEDVKSLMVTMGSVTDFKAAEEEAENAETPGAKESTKKEKAKSSSQGSGPKRLFRDTRRKVLGGVCAGMAHYFNIDPVWTRVVFALLALGSSGALIVLYIILWIALPETSELEDQPWVKKMFRDPENKVIGGVAAGLAAFTGTDLALIRLIFVITGIFGFGIILYIIFWIALPEATTLTEKMEMQGEPITLSNIESSVKKGLNEKDGQEESVLAKIILFPFRAIAAVLTALGKVLGPILTVFVDVLRIGVGAIITMMGLGFIVALILMFGITAGILTSESLPHYWNIQMFSVPVAAFRNSFPTWTVAFVFIAAFIPALVIFLLGVSTIAKRIIFRSTIGWTLFVLFFISIAFLSFSIPTLIYSFKEEGEVREEKFFTIGNNMPVLKIREVGLDDYDVTDITLRGYDGKNIKVVERFESQGSTRKIAAENAKMVDYNIAQEDSLIYFDSNITFKKDAQFRGQRLKLEVYIPNNTKFVIEDDLWRLINNYPRMRFDNYTHTWQFTDGVMDCVTCPDYSTRSYEDNRPLPRLNLKDQYGIRGFNALDLSGVLDVKIQRGDEFAVDLGNNDRLKQRYDVYMDGETLVISYDDNRKFFWNNKFWNDSDQIHIKITMPNLTDLRVTGAGKVTVKGFDENEMEIDMTGAVEGDMDFRVSTLNIDLTGASSIDMRGEGNFMEASATGASSIRAYGFEVQEAIVETYGASTAKVNVTQRIEIKQGFASNVSYRGNPEIVKKR